MHAHFTIYQSSALFSQTFDRVVIYQGMSYGHDRQLRDSVLNAYPQALV